MVRPRGGSGQDEQQRFQRRGRLTCIVYSGSFFEVSAQLIPVLFLVTVVEEKLQPDSEETPSERVGRSWLFVSLVIGELLALSVIAGGLSPSKGCLLYTSD